MRWIKKKLQDWLGITEIIEGPVVGMGVDVSCTMREPHMIMVFTKLNGGSVRFIPVNVGSSRELEDMVKSLKVQYGIREVHYDAPPGWDYF